MGTIISSVFFEAFKLDFFLFSLFRKFYSFSFCDFYSKIEGVWPGILNDYS